MVGSSARDKSGILQWGKWSLDIKCDDLALSLAIELCAE